MNFRIVSSLVEQVYFEATNQTTNEAVQQISTSLKENI